MADLSARIARIAGRARARRPRRPVGPVFAYWVTAPQLVPRPLPRGRVVVLDYFREQGHEPEGGWGGAFVVRERIAARGSRGVVYGVGGEVEGSVPEDGGDLEFLWLDGAVRGADAGQLYAAWRSRLPSSRVAAG